MRAIRDLRDLVNVSRLTYREDSDNEIENDLTYSNYGLGRSTHKPTPVIKKINSCTLIAPIQSKTTPIDKSLSKKNHYVLNSVVNNSSSSLIFRERDLLLDRDSLPVVQFSINKKPLPPLKSNSSTSLASEASKKNDFNKSIEPLEVEDLNYNNNNTKTNDPLIQNRFLNGNFDAILTFVDASVVSDWLNRANRYLKKMLKWHQDNTELYNSAKSGTKLLKYESYILFCNFWLGNNESTKFNDKQRRQLIEMEYSIICDEVMQAFQVGIDSQGVSTNDVNNLLRAVFKEYPIQLLSFRGTYLILDFVDVLSSDRDADYKSLLSDVKCRTLNKQYAQWLLSIRSFALINLCWSIVKFYRKSVEDQIKFAQKSSRKDNDMMSELDGRLSSLSVSNLMNKNNDQSECLSSSSTSSIGSKSSSASSKNSFKQKFNLRPKSCVNSNFTIVPTEQKYDHYLDAVFKSEIVLCHTIYERRRLCLQENVFDSFLAQTVRKLRHFEKNDLPDVLHYLITTKKCDPYKKDDQGRTLMFLAVMNEKPKILNYLVKRWSSIDINEECESGNTPLHAAVNKGNLNLVDILLESLNNSVATDEENVQNIFSDKKKVIVLDLNKPNPKCMNATALHLAVWNDFNEIAIKLIKNNANPHLKMNGSTTAFDLARENSNEVLHDLLSEYSNIKG